MVGEQVEPKIISLDEALKIAKNLELDLVEISPKTEPPICKIIDYKKCLYESLISIKRSGACGIFSYGALDIAKYIK